MRQSYALAIGVNSPASSQVPAAPLNPVLAVLLYNASGIAIAANSARLVRHTPHLPRDAAARLRAAPLEERRVR